MRATVVVCTTGATATLESTLSALEPQRKGRRLLVVAYGRAPRAAAAPGDLEVLSVEARDRAVARNRALAVCATPLLAFVDDDVVVPAGWLDAVEAAWKQAEPPIAWIGGPLTRRL